MDELTPQIPLLPETPPPSPAPPLPFRRPADYYAAPERPAAVLPRAVPYGCGAASLLFLVVLFAGGAILARGGGGSIMDALFGTIQSEVDGQFTKDVTAAQKAAFDAQFRQLRARIRGQRADFRRLQPLLRQINDATRDNRVTAGEAKALTDALREANK